MAENLYDSSDDEWFELMETNSELRPKRSYWVHDLYIKHEEGEYHKLCQSLPAYPNRFFRYYRMTEETFKYILENIRGRIVKFSSFRSCISPEERLTITIRYLSTGMSFRALSDSFRVSDSAIGKIVYEVCTCIYEEFVSVHMPVPTVEDLKEVSKGFRERWNYPQCLGCIDGKHIRIKCPPRSGTLFYNYKKFFSIVLQAVVDHLYRFTFIDVGAFGKQADGGVFSNSTLNCFIQNESNLPADDFIESIEMKMPYVFVADDAYPLQKHIMKPYSKKTLTNAEKIYNGRTSRARNCVECAFGILSNKWRLLLKTIETEEDHAITIVKAVCVLHNIIINIEGPDKRLVEAILLRDQETSTLCAVATHRRNNSKTVLAANIREEFKKYFSNQGAVLWNHKYLQ